MKTSEPLGVIDLSRYFQLSNHKLSENQKFTQQFYVQMGFKYSLSFRVSLMLVNPETHSMWKWVHEHFRCSPSCVLFMKVANRDYFLIGDTRYVLNEKIYIYFFFRSQRIIRSFNQVGCMIYMSFINSNSESIVLKRSLC